MSELDPGDDDRPPPSRRISCSTVYRIGLATFVALLIAAVLMPSYPSARPNLNEAQAIDSLWTIAIAEGSFSADDPDRDGVFAFGALKELGDAALIDSTLALGTKRGYVFDVGLPAPDDPQDPRREALWAASASPVSPGATGARYFGVDQAGVIFYARTAPFGIDRGRLAKPPDALPLGQ